MNELEPDLETELRRLRPAEPSTKLASAIDRGLRDGSSGGWPYRVRVSLWTSWTLTATAAAVAVMAWWRAPTSGVSLVAQPTTASEANVIPVGSSNVLLDARDEGIVVLDDGSAAHKVRLHYIDTVRMRERDASSSIGVSRPREEVRFVPVNFY